MAACAAVALIWLSAPRLIASLVAVPGDRAVFALAYGPTVTDKALELLIDSRAAAKQWSDDPAYSRETAQAALILAQRAGYGTVEALPMLQTVEEQALAALARAPADTESWARLAEARFLTGRPLDQVLEAYRNSILTGQYAPLIASRRVWLGLALWRRLSTEDRELVSDQIRLLAASGRQRDMEQLAEVSNSRAHYTLIILALLQRPDWVARFRDTRQALKIEPAITP